MLVVHATRGYKEGPSVELPIHQTLSGGYPNFNILELEERMTRHFSYLDLPEHLRTDKDIGGCFLQRSFFEKHGELINETNTFIFMGGKVNRCLTNAFLSALIAKLTPLEKVFAERPSILNIQESIQYLLGFLAQEGEDLNFHFNCEAIYPSSFDFRKVSKDPNALSWPPNIIMNALGAWHNKLLSDSGLTVRNHVDDKKISSNDKKNGRVINLYYWTSTYKMKGVLELEKAA